jgi:hypothetical protein
MYGKVENVSQLWIEVFVRSIPGELEENYRYP